MVRGTRARKLPTIRNRYFLFLDLMLVPMAAIISFLLRLDPSGWQAYAYTALVYAALALVVKPGIYFLFGLYRRFWRYASSRELIVVVFATLVATMVAMGVTIWPAPLVVAFQPVPRSIPFIDWLVSLALVGGARFGIRILADVWYQLPYNRRTLAGGEDTLRVLVMGAGDAGAMIVREMQVNSHMGLIPIGLVDDNRAKAGMAIHGVPVLGTSEDIPALVRKREVDEVVIAMPTAPGPAIHRVVDICRRVGVAYKTIPGIYELIAGRASVDQVRDVRIEDLLRRDPVQIEGLEALGYLEGQVVLVTGAGGSIGSELCRQIAAYRPQRLLLLGHGENSIYQILHEMRRVYPMVDVQPLIADVRDEDRLGALFGAHLPAVVFHAAAHKHVPLMECNVAEAVSNNVFGTQCVLAVAERYGVERLVLISTDKAVNPINVMGATKRIAELLVQEMAQRTGRAYAAVRFGNVLGSRGSVIPLFQGQIEAGGPVTVTHPEVERYFMTIPEAVQLVIRAGALAHGGEVFVLDMGEQVRIVDMAEELIRLNGLKPGLDIEIVFTGLRPGEKLSEELFAASEKARRTRHEKIYMANGHRHWDRQALTEALGELELLACDGNPERICGKMREIIPEYCPMPTKVGVLGQAFVAKEPVGNKI
jgi:FlaA1/EpsC-like NDP-sugar epimerase